MKTRLRSTWIPVISGILAVVIIIAVGFISIADYYYYSTKPADLPCRNCSGGARSVKVNGYDLYFREIGSNTTNPPIVVVHGGPGDSSQSFKQALDFLSKDHRVIYYDQRGSGNSQIKPAASDYTIDQLVEELNTLRHDVIKSEKIILIGHSAGGALVQRYALKYPGNVERMLLISSIPINNGVRIGALWDIFGPALFVLNAGLPPADPAKANAWFTSLVQSDSLSRLYDANNKALIENSDYLSFATYREVSRSLEGSDYHAELSALSVPALVIYGAADAPATGEKTAQKICSLLPKCTLAGFEKSGHWAFLEEPDQFAGVVNAFLALK